MFETINQIYIHIHTHVCKYIYIYIYAYTARYILNRENIYSIWLDNSGAPVVFRDHQAHQVSKRKWLCLSLTPTFSWFSFEPPFTMYSHMFAIMFPQFSRSLNEVTMWSWQIWQEACEKMIFLALEKLFFAKPGLSEFHESSVEKHVFRAWKIVFFAKPGLTEFHKVSVQKKQFFRAWKVVFFQSRAS